MLNHLNSKGKFSGTCFYIYKQKIVICFQFVDIMIINVYIFKIITQFFILKQHEFVKYNTS